MDNQSAKSKRCFVTLIVANSSTVKIKISKSFIFLLHVFRLVHGKSCRVLVVASIAAPNFQPLSFVRAVPAQTFLNFVPFIQFHIRSDVVKTNLTMSEDTLPRARTISTESGRIFISTPVGIRGGDNHLLFSIFLRPTCHFPQN